jgi:hypothetical protein
MIETNKKGETPTSGRKARQTPLSLDVGMVLPFLPLVNSQFAKKQILCGLDFLAGRLIDKPAFL